MDGLWFQAVERKYGMEVALGMDRGVWEQFAVIEARRIKARLALPEKGGLDALNIAFSNRLVSLHNKMEILRQTEKRNGAVPLLICRDGRISGICPHH
jgi:hypothetical protein